MKRFFLIGALAICVCACTSNWEYKIITVKGAEKESTKFDTKEFALTKDSLNALGKDGWELVSTYETTETVHPNFGNSEYVTGLQPNVRTAEINLVFKRRK